MKTALLLSSLFALGVAAPLLLSLSLFAVGVTAPLLVEARNGCVVQIYQPDDQLELHQLVCNGQVLDVKPYNDPNDPTLRRLEARVRVLKVHKSLPSEEVPEEIRVIFSIEADRMGKLIDTPWLPIPKVNQRYCLFLVRFEESGEAFYAIAMNSRRPIGFSVIPLGNDQKDDAPLLLRPKVTQIAVAKWRELRPELPHPIAHAFFHSARWVVTLSDAATPQFPQAQIFIAPSGKITDETWIAAEPLRRTTSISEEDLGIPLLLPDRTLLNHSVAEHPFLPSPAMTWGTVDSTDEQALIGLFYTTTHPNFRDTRYPKEELLGIQKLVVVPKPQPVRPLPLLPGL